MTPRENLLRVLAFDHPEYVPHGLPVHWLWYQGSNHQGLDGTGGDNSPAGSRWADIWGVGWHKELEGVMGLPVMNPLADITKVDSYPFPDPRDPRICGPIHGDLPEIDRDRAFLGGAHRDTLFEQAYMLVGMEALFIAFHEEPNAVRALFHRITGFHLGLAEQYVARGAEWANLGDDLGHQLGLLFSRETLEEFFLPEYRRLFGFYEERGVRVNFHSCGRVQDLVDVFIDLGIDVLNPVQASANDLPALRARTHRRLTLMGGVPSHVVYEGPPARIRAEVKEKIALLAPDGGYLCTPDQGLPFPEEHMEAFREAVDEYGRESRIEIRE